MGFLISLGIYSFRGVKVALDLANGATWAIAKSVFQALGATVYTLSDEPNGFNINKNSGSTHISVLQKFVLDNALDVGFAFDGDGDRCIAVSEKGEVIDGDGILYIYSKYMKERGKLISNRVVCTVMSNMGLFKALENEDIEVSVTSVGDKYVYQEMVKGGQRLGGEQSGHIIFSKYATTGDGILTSLKMMEVMLAKKKKFSELISGFTKYPQTLINVKVKNKKEALENKEFKRVLKQVEEDLKYSGRVLVRASGTEELIRIMVEDESKKKAEECAKLIEKTLLETL